MGFSVCVTFQTSQAMSCTTDHFRFDQIGHHQKALHLVRMPLLVGYTFTVTEEKCHSFIFAPPYSERNDEFD
jgi:hypothetical protein